MVSFLKSLFKNKSAEAKPAQAQAASFKDAATKEAAPAKKGKHDKETSCCGSCS